MVSGKETKIRRDYLDKLANAQSLLPHNVEQVRVYKQEDDQDSTEAF